MDLTPEEQAAAEQVGAEPEQIELPPQLVRGVLLFEKDNGEWGFKSVVDEDPDMFDLATLMLKNLIGLVTDITALKTTRMIAAGQKQQQGKKLWRPK